MIQLDFWGNEYSTAQSKKAMPDAIYTKSNKQYRIGIIDKTSCEQFLKKYHYLSKIGNSFRSGYNFGLWSEGGCLIGVCIFHTVSAWQTIKGCFGLKNKEQAGFWELGRLAMDTEHNGQNITSWFVARCIKLLRQQTDVRALISYADAEYHHGYIYQALNFKYYGLTDAKKDYWLILDGGDIKKMGRGTVTDKLGYWKDRSRKHRYMLVYDKSLKVLWKEEGYPKGDNTEYKEARA